MKGTSQDKATSNSAKIKPIALAVIELRLSEGISKRVSCQSVENRKFLKFCSNFGKGFEISETYVARHA